MINRREFGGALVGIAAQGIPNNLLANSLAAEQKPQRNALMHVGGDYHIIAGDDITSKQNLEYNLRHGVKHLTAEVSKNPEGAWDSDDLQRMKDNCDTHSVVFEAIRMNSRYINLLRKGPERALKWMLRLRIRAERALFQLKPPCRIPCHHSSSSATPTVTAS